MKAAMKHAATTRIRTLVAAAAFVVIGVMRGEVGEVLKKSIRVCLECIGIG